MTSRIFACAFAALALLVSNGAAARGRVVAASYYRAQDRQHLAAAIKDARLPAGAAVFLGTYGIDKDDAAAARSIPGGRYAPIVVPQAKEHPARNLPAADAAKIPKSLAKYAGAVPALKNLPRAERLAWGVEMGHRIRDGIRVAVRSGVRVDSFQLDEIWPTASDHSADGKAALQFLVGVLQGVHHGRTVLGDQPMTGLVHVAHPAKVAALPNDIDGQAFFTNLNAVAAYFVAEEYPSFSGNARTVARQQMASRDALRRGDAHRKALAERYIAGLTPGFKQGSSLGGRVAGQSEKAANEWRAAFIEESLANGAAGISEFNWTPQSGNSGGNASPALMKTVFAQVAAAMKK